MGVKKGLELSEQRASRGAAPWCGSKGGLQARCRDGLSSELSSSLRPCRPHGKDSGRTPCRCRCGEQPAGDTLPPDPAEPSRTQLRRPQLPRGLPARGEWATQGPQPAAGGSPNSVPGPGGPSCMWCPHRPGSGVSLAHRTSRPGQLRFCAHPRSPHTWLPSVTDGTFWIEVLCPRVVSCTGCLWREGLCPRPGHRA